MSGHHQNTMLSTNAISSTVDREHARPGRYQTRSAGCPRRYATGHCRRGVSRPHQTRPRQARRPVWAPWPATRTTRLNPDVHHERHDRADENWAPALSVLPKNRQRPGVGPSTNTVTADRRATDQAGTSRPALVIRFQNSARMNVRETAARLKEAEQASGRVVHSRCRSHWRWNAAANWATAC